MDYYYAPSNGLEPLVNMTAYSAGSLPLLIGGIVVYYIIFHVIQLHRIFALVWYSIIAILIIALIYIFLDTWAWTINTNNKFNQLLDKTKGVVAPYIDKATSNLDVITGVISPAVTDNQLSAQSETMGGFSIATVPSQQSNFDWWETSNIAPTNNEAQKADTDSNFSWGNIEINHSTDKEVLHHPQMEIENPYEAFGLNFAVSPPEMDKPEQEITIAHTVDLYNPNCKYNMKEVLLQHTGIFVYAPKGSFELLTSNVLADVKQANPARYQEAIEIFKGIPDRLCDCGVVYQLETKGEAIQTIKLVTSDSGATGEKLALHGDWVKTAEKCEGGV